MNDMRVLAYTLLAAAATYGSPALAINKCTGPDGKISFQDAPCNGGKAETIDTKPAAGRAVSSAASASAASAPKSETARLEGIIAASQRDRRALDLRERLLPNAERAVVDHRAACGERQKALAAQQYIYQQNMYGKTHAAQIASEMAAAAATCDTKDRELKDAADALAKECVVLRCRT